MCLADAIHNFKRVKIIKVSLSSSVPDPMRIFEVVSSFNSLFNVCDSCIIKLQESINLPDFVNIWNQVRPQVTPEVSST